VSTANAEHQVILQGRKSKAKIGLTSWCPALRANCSGGLVHPGSRYHRNRGLDNL